MDREPRSARSSRWPRWLAILAVVLLLAGGGFYWLGLIASEATEARARAHPDNFAQVVGAGEVRLNGMSSWTAVYHGPDAQQVAGEMFQPMIINPSITLRIESTIESERTRLAPVIQAHRLADDEASIASLHLGPGTHRVLVDFHGKAEAAAAGTVSFRRWRDPIAWPLLIVIFLAIPCWFMSLVAGITAGVWAFMLGAFRSSAGAQQNHTG